MTIGLIDDADFRIMCEAWRNLEALFRKNADFRMIPALPTAGTGDALESLYTFYNNPRDEDQTKKRRTSLDASSALCGNASQTDAGAKFKALVNDASLH